MRSDNRIGQEIGSIDAVVRSGIQHAQFAMSCIEPIQPVHQAPCPLCNVIQANCCLPACLCHERLSQYSI